MERESGACLDEVWGWEGRVGFGYAGKRCTRAEMTKASRRQSEPQVNVVQHQEWRLQS